MSDDLIITESSSGKPAPEGVVSMLVKSQSVLSADQRAKDAAPGSTAYTADLSFMAMKDPDGVWRQIGG